MLAVGVGVLAFQHPSISLKLYITVYIYIYTHIYSICIYITIYIYSTNMHWWREFLHWEFIRSTKSRVGTYADKTVGIDIKRYIIIGSICIALYSL